MCAQITNADLTSIRGKLSESSESDSQNLFYKDKLLFRYKQRIYGALKEIFNGYEKRQDFEIFEAELTALCVKNWALVQGTALSYLAIPNHPVTKLLCDCIKLLDKDPSTALHTLMPGVICTDDALSMPIERALVTHVLTHNGRYLNPVACVLDLSDPGTSEYSTKGFRSQATDYEDEYLTEEQYFITDKSDQDKILHHSDETENLYNAYLDRIAAGQDSPSLAGEIERLLPRLYFNSVNGVGEEEVAGVGGAKAIAQFFKFYDQVEKEAEEKLRAKEDGQDDQDGREKILEQIKILGQIIDHSKGSREGVPELATCLATRRQKLLDACRGHEQLLASICLNGEDAKNTWLENAQEALKEATDTLKKKLVDHSYAGRQQGFYTKKLLEEFNITITLETFEQVSQFLENSAAEELKAFLINNNYKLAHEVVDILSLEDLVTLGHCLPIEKYTVLLEVINETEKQDKFVQSAGDLCTFLSSFVNIEKIQKIIDVFDWRKVIQTGKDFCQLLRYLSAEQRTVMFATLQDELSMGGAGFIKTARDFHDVSRYLSVEHRELVFDAIKESSQDLIKDACDISWLISYLSLEQSSTLVEKLKNRFFGHQGLIKSGYDFADAITGLYDEQITLIFNVAKNENKIFKSHGFIKTAEDFYEAFSRVPPNLKETIFDDEITAQLYDGGLINTARDLSYVLQPLPLRQFKQVISILSERKKLIGDEGLIQTSQDLVDALSLLCDANAKVLVEKLNQNGQLDRLITDAEQFLILFASDSLSSDKKENLFKALNACDKILQKQGIIKTPRDFKEIFYYLSPKQRVLVSKAALEQKVLFGKNGLINSSANFISVFSSLDDEMKMVVLVDLIKNKKLLGRDGLINSVVQFKFFVGKLSSSHMKLILDHLQDKIFGDRGFIKNASHVSTAFSLCRDRMVKALCFEALRTSGMMNNEGFFETTADLVNILTCFCCEGQVDVVLSLVKSKFIGEKKEDLIRTPKLLAEFIASVRQDQQVKVVRKLVVPNKSWKNGLLIKFATHLRDMCFALKVGQITTLLETVKQQGFLLGRNGLIKTSKDCDKVLYWLESEKIAAVLAVLIPTEFDWAKHRFLIESTQRLGFVLEHLSVERASLLLNSLQQQGFLSGENGLIKTTQDFINVLSPLSNEKIKVLLECLKGNLFGDDGLIANSENLKRVCDSLSTEQINELHRNAQINQFILTSENSSNFDAQVDDISNFDAQIDNIISGLKNKSYKLGLLGLLGSLGFFSGRKIDGKLLPDHVKMIIETCQMKKSTLKSSQAFEQLKCDIREMAADAAKNPPLYLCGLWNPRDPETQEFYNTLSKGDDLVSSILK